MSCSEVEFLTTWSALDCGEVGCSEVRRSDVKFLATWSAVM